MWGEHRATGKCSTGNRLWDKYSTDEVRQGGPLGSTRPGGGSTRQREKPGFPARSPLSPWKLGS